MHLGMRRRVHRTLVVTVALLAILLPAVPGQAEPEVYSGGDAGQTAFAAWGVPSGDRRFPMDLSLVLVYRGVVPDGFGTYAAVGKLRCQMPNARGWNPFGCRGRVAVHELAFEDFWMDPVMASAHARIQDGGRLHRVEWEGTGSAPTPLVFPFVWPPEEEQFVNAYMWGKAYRDAVASGKILGRSFAAGHRNAVAGLDEGTFSWVSVYPWLDEMARSGKTMGARAFFSRIDH